MTFPRSITTRSALLLMLLALVFLISASILVVVDLGARRTMRDLSQRYIDQSADQVQSEMSHFFGSIEEFLNISRAWWESGILDYNGRADLQRLNAMYIPLLDQHRQITSMMLIRGDGLEYLLFRDLRGGDDYEWYNRLVWADRGSAAGYVVRWTSDLQLYSEEPLPEDARDYDPRRRPFYTGADLEKTHWTSPYYFFITKDAGLTVSQKWRDQASGQTRLVAFDLLLRDLSGFTSKLRPSPNGKAFVLHNDGSLIGLPADARWTDSDKIREILRKASNQADSDQAATLLTPEDLDLTVIRDALAWRNSGEDLQGVFSFESEGGAWWSGFRQFKLQDQSLWIGVAVPERDFLGEAERQRYWVLGVSTAAVLLALLLAGIVARHFSRPLEALAEQSVKIRDLNLADAPPVESRVREIKQLAEAQSQMLTGIRSFSRYVSVALVRDLVRRGEVAMIGGKRTSLTVLFTDIRDFTRIAESMGPEELTHHMSGYFELMITALQSERGTVDKIVGDGIVAFWGAPDPLDHHAAHAISAVLKCQRLLRDQNSRWQESDRPGLTTHFGLCTGAAVVGNVGAPERLSYTALGDTVNTASRLEALNVRYGTEVLATQSVVSAAGSKFVWRRIDRVRMKGKTIATDIYEPLGEASQVSDGLRQRAKTYEEALRFFTERRFADAVELLDSVLTADPQDGPSLRLHELCRGWINNPPPEKWDGVTLFAEK
jgi:adenylate cyclase